MEVQLENKVDSHSLHYLQKDNDDLQKAISSLKSKLFKAKRGRSPLKKANEKLQSGLTSINDQQVKLVSVVCVYHCMCGIELYVCVL